VNSVENALSDEQTISNDMVVSVNHSEAGVLKMLGVPYRFSDTPATINKAPPLLGEDNKEILQSIGYDNDQIDSLIKSEVI
jgi:crotonobetainyl-CoA:carnitine CoA-transferase CaiB-like acyl-CoA transferase